MKTKLILIVSDRVIRKARRYSKKSGKSLSRIFEELFESEERLPVQTEAQRAAGRLPKQLEKSQSVKTLNDKALLKQYLAGKYA